MRRTLRAIVLPLRVRRIICPVLEVISTRLKEDHRPHWNRAHTPHQFKTELVRLLLVGLCIGRRHLLGALVLKTDVSQLMPQDERIPRIAKPKREVIHLGIGKSIVGYSQRRQRRWIPATEG